MLVSSEFAQRDLLSTLETELKVKITKYSPVVTAGSVHNDMDAIYAMGACVDASHGIRFRILILLKIKRLSPNLKATYYDIIEAV